MTAHTHTPWVFEPGPQGDPDVPDADFIIAQQDGLGEVVATVVGPCQSGTPEGNAEFIVRACNAHDQLLACLKEAVASWELADMDETDDSEAGEAMAEWKAAIAKAEPRS